MSVEIEARVTCDRCGSSMGTIKGYTFGHQRPTSVRMGSYFVDLCEGCAREVMESLLADLMPNTVEAMGREYTERKRRADLSG